MRNDYFSDLLPETVTPVTPANTTSVTSQALDVAMENNDLTEALRPLRPLRLQNDNTENKCAPSAKDEAEIRAWLHYIDETDMALINEVLHKCRTDSDAMAYFLHRAEKVRAHDNPVYWGQRQCITCTQWRKNRCHATQYQRRDNYGRLLDYAPDPLQYWRCNYHSQEQLIKGN